MLGAVALHVLPVIRLSWVGASFALLALLPAHPEFSGKCDTSR